MYHYLFEILSFNAVLYKIHLSVMLFNILYRNVVIAYIYEMLSRMCYTWLYMLIVNIKRSSSM